MEFLKLLLNSGHRGSYSYEDASSIGMCVLANFFSSDVYEDSNGYKEWALDERFDSANSNATCLEKVPDGIYLFDGTEGISEQSRANGIKVSLPQFLQLMDDWNEKVWKRKPKEVIIKHENDRFIIETHN